MMRTDQTFTIAHLAEGEAPRRCNYDQEHPLRCAHRATFAYRNEPYCLQHATRLAERDMCQLLLDQHLELQRLRSLAKR
jgi:hypothetical protein